MRAAQCVVNPNAICTMLAGWWLPRILACAQGCRVSSLLRWRAQRAPGPGWPDWFTTISSNGLCVRTYKYQPPTDNPLSKLQRSPPEPAWCLGFYHIYILHSFSWACQWCIFKAFPSLREGLTAFTAQALRSVLPWPGPTMLPSVHPDMGDPMPGGITYWHTKWAMKTGPQSKR